LKDVAIIRALHVGGSNSRPQNDGAAREAWRHETKTAYIRVGSDVNTLAHPTRQLTATGPNVPGIGRNAAAVAAVAGVPPRSFAYTAPRFRK
jgi:hypothetical protein